MNKKYIIRKLVQIKFFMSQSYDWARTPALVTVALGVMKPYIDQYFNISLWLLIVITTISTIVVGWALVRLGVIKEATSYAQEQNGLLNDNIKNIQKSIDELKEMNNPNIK